MVFESVVADVLNKVLGDYIENLDHKQLKIGIWGGDVVLENLKIRENALDEMDLPVQLIYGYLGKLVLKIPWKNLYSQPVIVKIEDLYCLVQPNNNVEYNAEKEAKYAMDAKKIALDALEAARKKELEKDKPKPDAGFAEKLTAQIVNNLQVQITNVHVRYEDTTTTGSPFSFGISLHELELYTTDADWEKCYMSQQASQVFKIANLSCLSAYLNCGGNLFSSNKSELTPQFQTNIARKDAKPSNYQYVLGPISCNAKLKLNMNPEFDDPPFERPKIDLTLEMETLNVGLTDTQFENLMKLGDAMNRQQLGLPYRKYRPHNLPYKGHAKEWWKFAITCVLEEDIRKPRQAWTWAHMKAHRDRCHTYASKYKELSLNKKPPAVLVETCRLLETELDAMNLLMIRQRVNIEIEKKRETEPVQKAGWFGGWFGGGEKKEEKTEGQKLVEKFEAAMTSEEKEKMYNAIGYQENAKPTDLPVEYVAILMNFKLVALEVGLYKDESKGIESHDFASLPSILLLKFSMATAAVRQRPAGDALSITAGMKELKVTGLKQNDYTPLLVESKITDEFNLLDVFFETNPIDKICDQRVKVVARPLQIIYDAPTVLALISTFKAPGDVTLSKFEESASLQMSNFKERSATGMQYLIDKKPVLDADILLMPNILIMPHKGTYVENQSPLLVVSMGQVHISSTPRRHSASVQNLFHSKENKDDILKAVMDNAYDKFTVKLDDIQVLVVRSMEPWQTALKAARPTEMHVLRPVSLKLTAALCVMDNDPRMPKVKIDIEVPSIMFNISEDRVILALRVALSIPLPNQDAPPPRETLLSTRSSRSSMVSISNFINKEVKKISATQESKNQPLSGEIVQYTNLEVNFSLGNISFGLFQGIRSEFSSTVSVEYLTPEGDRMPMPVVPDAGTQEPTQEPVRDLPPHQILSVDVRRLEAYFAARTYESVATVKLGGISLCQYDTQEDNMEVLEVINTPDQDDNSNYLFTVSCTIADKTSPEFNTKYNSTEQLIVANFKVLRVVLHQECLKRLLEVAGTFQNELAAIMMMNKPQLDRVSYAGGGDGIARKLTVILEDTEEIMSTTSMKKHKKTARHRVVESVKVRIIANLDELGLVLTSRRRALAEMNVKKFVANVILKSSYTEVNMGLKDIQVIDMNPNTIHKNILSIVGKDAFNCQLVMYNKEETSDYNSDDMKITVDIGCMKIVFLNWFVAGVMSFLNEFQEAQKALSDASAAAAETARQKALDAYETATRLNLNIRIKAPVIVIPTCSVSNDALCLDLGLLEITNNTAEITVPNEERLAVIDEIKLQICDVKISKIVILDGHETSVDDVDAAYGFSSKFNMMNPMSCTVLVTRNLSYGWYKEVPEVNLAGRLKSVELTLFADDYALVISVMNNNLSEGLAEFPPPEEIPPEPIKLSSERPSKASRPSRIVVQPKAQKVHESLKFNFQFDGVIINLMEDEDKGLARFGIYFLSIKGTKLDNDTMSTSVVLCNIQMDDTRQDTKSKIRQYLSRKDWVEPKLKTEDIIDACYNELNYMVDVTAITKPNDTFAEVRVRGFDMIVCIDFLMKLTTFLALPAQTPPVRASAGPEVQGSQVFEARDTKTTLRSSTMSNEEKLEKSAGPVNTKMNLILHIDEPDIILVENLDDLNTSCIIFNAKAHLNYRSLNDKQLVNGQIDSLKMYMCAFLPERRESTRHYILHPCEISLQGSTPEEEGMHISLKLSDIIVNVSPATIELLNKAMLSISTGTMAKAAIVEESRNYSKIWLPRHLHGRNYWFTRVEQAEEAFEDELIESPSTVAAQGKTEKCVIEVPSITLVIESGVGYYTRPLISMDVRITAVFNNWSRNLTAQGSLTLNMNYYNQTLAEWEPIIELNEIENKGIQEYSPWELKFSMGMETVPSEVEGGEPQQALHMNIHSEETLEITLSKTCLGLLSDLGEAFSQAIDQKGLVKPDVVAPFVLENDTGFEVTLNVTKGKYTLHEVHRGVPSANGRTFSVTAETTEIDPVVIKTCTISSGGRAYLQTKDFSLLDREQANDESLYVQIGDIKKEIALPVAKSDTRYFELFRSPDSEPWGIVSKVREEYGTTKINIHGVVSIHNHFTTNVCVYRRNLHPTKQNFEDILVGRIPAGGLFHVPLHAIYGEHKELYFAMKGYRPSVQGISWAAHPSDTCYNHQLSCDPISSFEPLFINARRTKTEIYYEHTNKYTILSAFYTIHLRPPLYLRNCLPIDMKVSVAGCAVRNDGLEEDSSTALIGNSYQKEDLLDYGEKEVRSGDVLLLPTVRLVEKGKDRRTFLVVRLLQYLEKDWSCATAISSETGEVSPWQFSSYDSEMRVDMDLYVMSEDRNGSVMLTLYSPFWMINKTGKMLTYRTETSSMQMLYHPPEYSGPILFTFRDNSFFDKKKASIRCDNGEWSEKIPLDVAGAIGEVTCEANSQKYHIGVHNHMTQNSLTKQITFIPFYIVCNKCRFTVELQEQSRPGDPWLALSPGQFEPLWPKNETKNNLVVRVEGKVTPAFDYKEVICTLLKLENSKYGGINVDVQTTEGGVYITFTDYKPGDAPGLLINHTGRQVVYYEKGTKNEKILNAKSTTMYAWDDPTGPKMLVFGNSKEENDLKRDGCGEVVMQDGYKSKWVSFLDGLQRVLLFTDDDSIVKRTETTGSFHVVTQSIDVRIHGIGLSVVNNETGLDILYLGVTSSGIIWESKKVTKKRYKEMTINDNALLEAEYQRYLLNRSVNEVQSYTLDNKFPIDFVDMKLKKSVVRDLRRSFYPAIWLARKSSPHQNQLHVKINRIQIDNQFVDPIFPVVLAPIPPPKSVANTCTLKPFIECSMVQRIMPNSQVRQFKYAKLLIQEFHFKVDLNFLTAISEMFVKEVTDDVKAKQFRQDVESIQMPLSVIFEEHSMEEQKSFYDNLHLGPLKIHVSFSMANSDTKALPGVLGTVIQGVGVTLTDVNDVVFRLAFFEREYQFFSQHQLINEITSHYTGQALKQLYVLVLGLDVLGNPYGLVVGLKKGVEDLFYEPFQGAIQGPGEFAEGLVLGVKSLFGHTVGGAAGAMSKITGAMGKGLAALTFDEEYQRKRRQGIHNKPKNFHEGLARSSKGLVMGFYDGVTGVVTKPVSGAREHGVEGFFKGLGKGAIGLVARPTAGVVDFASGSFDAVKRAAEASEDVKRMRPPRFQHYDFVLRPYCYMEAFGNKILKETDKGKFSNTDSFLHCEEIIPKNEYMIVTNYRLLYVQRNEMFGIWTSLWSYLWNEISAVESTSRGVQITVKQDGKKVLGLFATKESPRKLVLLGDERRRRHFVDKIESHRNDPNPMRTTVSYPVDTD